MLWDPTTKPFTSVACPLEFSGAEPREVEPSRNVTLPVGIAVTPRTFEPATVVVKVTGAPAWEGLADEGGTWILSPLVFSSTVTPEKARPSPDAITSATPSPLTSAKARPRGSRSEAYSTGS